MASTNPTGNGKSSSSSTDHDLELTEESTKIKSTLTAWNPMEEEANSFFNTFDRSNNPASFLGDEIPEADQISEIPCRYYRGIGETCFRAKCLYKHDKELSSEAGMSTYYKRLDSKPKLVEVILLEELESNGRAPNGMINSGVVTCVVSPGEFYIVPNTDWTCACKYDDDEPLEKNSWGVDDKQERFSGVSHFQNMFKHLDFLTTNQINQRNVYVRNQLVAVKIASGGEGKQQKQWYRAVVLENVVLGETILAPRISLRLLDYGSCLTVTTKDVIPLPRVLLRYPPMSYKCALYGVSPLRHRWSSKCLELFTTLTHNQECVFEIRQTVPPFQDELAFEQTPYQIDLYLKVGDKFINLGEHLAEEGLALAWHPFPTRPLILESLAKDKGLCTLFSKQDEPYAKFREEIPAEIVERERERLEKLLTRAENEEGSKKLKSVTS